MYPEQPLLLPQVQNVEREEKERNSEQVRNLQDKLAVSTEKVSSQALELDIIRTEHMKLKEHTSDVEARLTEARMQCESMNTVKDELSSSAQERLADIERLTQERDYYFKLLGDKDKELTNLRGDVQRLTIQNEERDKSHTALREQRETLNDTSRTLQQENKTLKVSCYEINSLWPSGAIWRQGFRSTLVQVMACCLTAPSHYLNQCWLTICMVQWHSYEVSFIRDTSAIDD